MHVRASLALGWLLLSVWQVLSASVEAQSATPSAAGSGSRIYKYRTQGGREVFTNLLEQVPTDQRDHAEVDLSRVSLNTELGAQLDAKLQQQHQKLIATPFCEALREDAAEPWQVIWRDDSPLVIFGGMLLVFVLITPSMVSRFGAAIWMRTLSMAFSWLTLAGLMTYGTMYASRTASKLRTSAKPCEVSTWQELAKEDKALEKHFDLVTQLERQAVDIERIHQESK